MRESGGPRFLHAITYRVKGHVSVDPARYRAQGELDVALEGDPLARAEAGLLALGVGSAEIERARSEALEVIQEAVARAKAAPSPAGADAYREVQDTGAGAWS
jgi:pyruvate dehydrogenase E1 component alpha subunit